MKLTIGTRASDLAVWQAEHVASLLREQWDGLEVELKRIKTTGDRILDRPLADIGGKGLFVKEIEAALYDESIDLAVHSLKDMPTEQPEGLTLCAVLPRAEPFDMLCCREAEMTFDALPQGARIGTGSARRGLQMQLVRPDLEIVPLRGNVQTRLSKRQSDNLDAVVLAESGLKRLEISEPGFHRLQPHVVVPAPGQGALVIEVRTTDEQVRSYLEPLRSRRDELATTMERACLDAIGGDCHTPFAAWAQWDEKGIELVARLFGEAGFSEARETVAGSPETLTSADLDAAGRRAGERLLAGLDTEAES